mmetsp:Transcript_6590/g.16796  ORF Transcript_6590/g.16796 Transcript_6590/m.16796 type:complete len:93 (-) Transcript_6590:41-319(-)
MPRIPPTIKLFLACLAAALLVWRFKSLPVVVTICLALPFYLVKVIVSPEEEPAPQQPLQKTDVDQARLEHFQAQRLAEQEGLLRQRPPVSSY